MNYFERKNIQILGEVNVPGSYPLLSDGESLQSFINRAGGLAPRALKNGVSIFREKFYFEDPPEDKVLGQLLQSNPFEDTNLIEEKLEKKNNQTEKIKLAWEGFGVTLMPGDSIIVKEKTGAVYVTGEVYSPGLVEFQRGKSVKYYLNAAGGINNYGDNKNVVVVYPNGITAPWRTFRTPRISDGSTIVVYQKADLTPFDVTTFASTTASLLTSLVTIMVLSQQLTGQ
jgi:protein involved in polysaccharide export with SLBB domain